MVEVNPSNVDNCGYARFYIFPATPTDVFKCNKNTKDAISDDENANNLYSENPQWNLHQFDWDHPSTYIDFPLQGQIEGSPWQVNLFGRDIKLRLMETANMTDNYCMKLSNQGLGFAGTWHSTTGPTRLVRDI